MKKGLFKISADVLGQERMLVVVTPARPQSPVEDLSYHLAQDALDTTRSVGGSAFEAALTEAGFGQTTRGAVALTDDTDDSGPGPAILSLELRTVAGGLDLNPLICMGCCAAFVQQCCVFAAQKS